MKDTESSFNNISGNIFNFMQHRERENFGEAQSHPENTTLYHGTTLMAFIIQSAIGKMGRRAYEFVILLREI